MKSMRVKNRTSGWEGTLYQGINGEWLVRWDQNTSDAWVGGVPAIFTNLIALNAKDAIPKE